MTRALRLVTSGGDDAEQVWRVRFPGLSGDQRRRVDDLRWLFELAGGPGVAVATVMSGLERLGDTAVSSPRRRRPSLQQAA